MRRYGGNEQDEAKFQKANEEIRNRECHVAPDEKLEQLELMLEGEWHDTQEVIE